MSANQRFNVDLRFLYATIWEPQYEIFSTYYGHGPQSTPSGTVVFDKMPAWTSGRTDWHTRAITLPTIDKSYTSWSGQFQTGRVEFVLAEYGTQLLGSLYGSVYGSTSPIGNQVAIYAKAQDNPPAYYPVFTGRISNVKKNKGQFTLGIEDTFRNIYNSQFVPDYIGLATFIGSVLYGTLKDVQGTTLYVDDRGNRQLIKHRTDVNAGGIGWIGAAVTGAAMGAFSGPAGAVVGFVGGLLSGLNSSQVYDTYTYQVDDYNAIPDGMIFGGQPLKFTTATCDARANGVNGALYQVPALKVRGGQFDYGIYGTIEIDELINNVSKGDYIFTEMPLIYWGSPDDIIMFMLTGSNVTVQSRFPDDFSSNWLNMALALKHIEAYSYVTNLDNSGSSYNTGEVVNQIDSLCKEFGFSFYLDESNRYSIRSIRRPILAGSQVLGTFAEEYNILGDGVTWIDDIQNNYTDIDIKYQDSSVGNIYQEEILLPLPLATYTGGMRRVLEINAQWIHDSVTANYMAKRLARRYGTAVPQIEFDAALYSVPVALGDIIDVTAWAVGSHRPFEVTGYTKDFAQNKIHIKAEDASYAYYAPAWPQTRFFFISGTANQVATLGQDVSNMATVWRTTAAHAVGYYGTLVATLGFTDREMKVVNGTALFPGLYLSLGATNSEIIVVRGITNETAGGAGVVTCKISRAQFNTISGTYLGNELLIDCNDAQYGISYPGIVLAGLQSGTFLPPCVWF